MEEDFIDLIGFNGPIFITIIAFLNLLDKMPYLIGFIFFNVLNIQLNEVLKNWFVQPRPEKINLQEDQKLHIFYKLFGESLFRRNLNNNSVHVYGMPSGHAQTAAFALGFLFIVCNKLPYYIIISSASLFCLTLFQRWYRKKHTIYQLLIGSIIGFIFAVFSYQIIRHIMISKTIKSDMNDFIYKFWYSNH